jgi:uncharacterized protein YbjT (DUF2867 family)
MINVMNKRIKIGIVGGSGFLGKNLTNHLLENSNWDISVISHHHKTFPIKDEYSNRVTFVEGDALNPKSISRSIADLDVVYYFIHMMGQKDGDMYELEEKAANIFKQAVIKSTVKRVIFMGGLGDESDALSKHLSSRHRTGTILRSMNVDVIEFQASMIIGRGSVAFDIMANLVDRLPIMPLPNTSSTLTQPILLADVLKYLYSAATVSIKQNCIVQIGGPEQLTYEEIYRAYAKASSKKRLVIRTPFVPAWLEAQFLDLFTPTVHARIGKSMVESLGNEMIVTSRASEDLFPDIKPYNVSSRIKTLAE